MITQSKGFIKAPPSWGNMVAKYSVCLLNLALYVVNIL